MFCPHCDSSNVRKLSLIYENGLSFVNTKTSGVGIGIGRGGIGVGFGGGRTKGTQTTALGSKAAPPMKKQWGGFVGGAFVLLVLTAFSAWFWLGVIVFALFLVDAIRYNRNVWPQLYGRWNEAYMCERCGEIGVPQRGQPTVIVTRGSVELGTTAPDSLEADRTPDIN